MLGVRISFSTHFYGKVILLTFFASESESCFDFEQLIIQVCCHMVLWEYLFVINVSVIAYNANISWI